jgi:hypothetical protein
MSVLDGPGEGTWSVFAQKVVEQRDKAIEERNDVFRRLREAERRCVSLERERDEALRLLTTRVEAKRLDEAQEEIARLCAEAQQADEEATTLANSDLATTEQVVRALRAEIERLRTFIRMIAAFEGEWQADAQEVLAASTEEKP